MIACTGRSLSFAAATQDGVTCAMCITKARREGLEDPNTATTCSHAIHSDCPHYDLGAGERMSP